MMQQKKFSKRLNYDVINKLFDNDVVTKTKKNSYSDSEDERGGRGSAYFHSDAETNDVEKTNSSTGKRSRIELNGKARKGKAASSAGEESGTERGQSKTMTDGETDAEGNNWKMGLSLPYGASGGEEDYGDRYGDDGEGIFE